MKIKKVLLVLVSLFVFNQLFAISDPYSTADDKTKEILKNCDNLISKKKYESAYGSLNVDPTNEYIIAKRIEICTSYFCQSIMHQMFAFSDLKKGQTLNDVRRGNGNFNLVMDDPVEIVESFVAENGNKPILDYSLGIYYGSVLECYGSNWLISQQEIIQKMADYYQKALDQNCYTGYSLSELALSYLRLNNYEKTIETYDFKKTTDEEITVEDNYNYGYCCYLAEDYEKAEPLLLQSVKDYADDPDYLYDTYYILSNLYLYSSKYDDCEKFIQNCLSIYTDDYRVYKLQIALYASKQDKEKTIVASQKLFSMAPTNPSAPQMVMQIYFDSNVQDWLVDFFVETEAKYKDNLSAMQNLAFHHAASLSYLGKTEEAKTMAQTAKELFKKNNSLTDEISNQLDSIGK